MHQILSSYLLNVILLFPFRITISSNASFKVGALVAGPFGWRTHAVSNGMGVTILSDLGNHPASYGIGALGMPG